MLPFEVLDATSVMAVHMPLGVCSCDRSCSCGCLKPSFAVVPGLKSPFVLAFAVVDDLCAAVAVLLAIVPIYNPSFAVVIAVVPG